MMAILIRTFIIYGILLGLMRLMGKRQLGELEINELVTTLLISEIASLPIENTSIPISHAIIPLVTILTLETTLSVILIKCPRLKWLASARPSILIRHGEIDQRELRRSRISIDELISEVRQQGIGSFTDVDYMILEQNGKISVIVKREAQPPTAKDMGHKAPEDGVIHAIIEDGRVNDYNMQLLGLDSKWLSEQLKGHCTTKDKVFFLGMNDIGDTHWIEKE